MYKKGSIFTPAESYKKCRMKVRFRVWKKMLAMMVKMEVVERCEERRGGWKESIEKGIKKIIERICK